MKITCNSCGSKYNIADAKVRGKKVKVRCKGCKESILVDGTHLDSEGGAPGDSRPGGSSLPPVSIGPSSSPPLSEAVSSPQASGLAAATPAMPPRATPPQAEIWSVNITDDDSREMTLGELVDAWKSGVVTHDAYVWKDGMSDWKPILEVGELKLKLGAGAPVAGIVTSTGAAAAAPVNKMDDLFGSAASAGSESNPLFGVLGEPEAEKATGARNDSSVLFSLDSLKSAVPTGQARANPNELFGNLDTGAGQLGGGVDLLAAPVKAPPPAPAGARPVTMAGAALGGGAPSKGKGGIIFAILAGAALIGGVLFFMGGAGEEDTAAAEKLKAAEAKIEAAEKEAEEAKKKAEDDRKKMEADLKKARESSDEEEKKDEKSDENSAKSEKSDAKQAEKDAVAKKSDSSGSTAKSSSSGGSKPAPKKTEKVGGFNKSAAKSSLSRAASIAASCKRVGAMTGSGKVRVTFSTSGRVTSSTVISGPLRGTTVGGCVASTFRRARIPKFSGSPVTVSKSFSVK